MGNTGWKSDPIKVSGKTFFGFNGVRIAPIMSYLFLFFSTLDSLKHELLCKQEGNKHRSAIEVITCMPKWA